MQLVRHHDAVDIPMIGEVPKTQFCEGAWISLDEGRDGMCCVRCHLLRQAIYRKKRMVSPSVTCLEFIRNFPPAKTACFATCCDETTPAIFYQSGDTEMEIKSFLEPLKEQFKLRKKLGIIEKEIKKVNITHNAQKMPIVMPGFTSEKFQGEESDDGVKVSKDGKSIIVSDIEKAYKAGKWMYLINFYQALLHLDFYSEIKSKKIDGHSLHIDMSLSGF